MCLNLVFEIYLILSAKIQIILIFGNMFVFIEVTLSFISYLRILILFHLFVLIY